MSIAIIGTAEAPTLRDPSPPAIAPKDKVSGLPKKMTFGAWMLPMFGVLARMRFLRGTAFDFFGRTYERKMERQLIETYEATVTDLAENLNSYNYSIALQIAQLPEKIRGYGHVKEESVELANEKLTELLSRFKNVIPLKEIA